ncbi:MAG: thioesterase family protein [Gemmatimonadota bacterium]
MSESPSAFRFHHPVTVRFRDIDVGGHAHHSEALMYFEEARWAYWRKIVGRGGIEDIDYVIAEARIRWHQRVLWPQTVQVGVRVSRLGRKHFDIDYEVRSEDGALLVSGATVQVMFDYAAERSVGLPDDLRATLTEFDGPFARSRDETSKLD